METISANEAKTQFGEMLLKVQREPVQIHKNGKPVAVVLSIDVYEGMEALKLSALRSRAEKVLTDTLIDSEDFMDRLQLGEFD